MGKARRFAEKVRLQLFHVVLGRMGREGEAFDRGWGGRPSCMAARRRVGAVFPRSCALRLA